MLGRFCGMAHEIRHCSMHWEYNLSFCPKYIHKTFQSCIICIGCYKNTPLRWQRCNSQTKFFQKVTFSFTVRKFKSKGKKKYSIRYYK